MNDTDLLFSPVTYIVAIFGLFALLLLLTKFLVNIGAKEIAIKERRYFGSRMPAGRVVAIEGEVGIQAKENPFHLRPHQNEPGGIQQH